MTKPIQHSQIIASNILTKSFFTFKLQNNIAWLKKWNDFQSNEIALNISTPSEDYSSLNSVKIPSTHTMYYR